MLVRMFEPAFMGVEARVRGLSPPVPEGRVIRVWVDSDKKIGAEPHGGGKDWKPASVRLYLANL